MSSEIDLMIASKPREGSAERDMIVRAANAMLRNSQELTRNAISRQAGLSVATIAKHFRCRTDLVTEIEVLRLSGRNTEVVVSRLDQPCRATDQKAGRRALRPKR